jgi:lauroyl/myristoyl acyltransferase
MLALDRLPWPWGEEILAASFVARAFVRTSRLRQALIWAASQESPSRWRLAMALCSRHGRFVARSGLVGLREPEALHRVLTVRGEEYLAAAPRGVIFLGFHLGPSNSYVGLRAAGHRLTWIGGRGASGAWSREIRRDYQTSEESRFFSAGQHAWVRRLHQARLLLQRGENVFISADGEGAQAFTLPLSGGPMSIARGWLTLRRTTNAPVLPVLSHMEGYTQVVTIHAPLPPRDPEDAVDLAACRNGLASLLADYVRRFPDHCYSLAFQAPAIEGRTR